MIKTETITEGSFELSAMPEPSVEIPSPPAEQHNSRCLSESLLFQNVMWYCRLRWLVVSILVVYGLLGQVGPWVQKVGWRHPGIWPFLAAGALIAANIGFLWNARHGRTHRMPQRNLWSQIILDLLVLTVVVHFWGAWKHRLPSPICFTLSWPVCFLRHDRA